LFVNASETRLKKVASDEEKAVTQQEKRHFLHVINVNLIFFFVQSLDSYSSSVSVHLQGKYVSLKNALLRILLAELNLFELQNNVRPSFM